MAARRVSHRKSYPILQWITLAKSRFTGGLFDDRLIEAIRRRRAICCVDESVESIGFELIEFD